MISRAAKVFAAQLVRHRSAACEFSRGRFDVWPRIVVIIIFNTQFSYTGVVIGCFVPCETLLCRDNASAVR